MSDQNILGNMTLAAGVINSGGIFILNVCCLPVGSLRFTPRYTCGTIMLLIPRNVFAPYQEVASHFSGRVATSETLQSIETLGGCGCLFCFQK